MLWDPATLDDARRRSTSLQGGVPAAALERLARDAASAMAAGPFTVVTKAQQPPSGDRHDYLSLSPYWWPDDRRPDGLPWVRRDGERNPIVDAVADAAALRGLARHAATLALAWWYLGDSAAARRAGVLLRTWFVEPATAMNPNFDFAQGVPGREAGRPAGLIEARHLIDVVAVIGLLDRSAAPALGERERKAVSDWFRRWYRWLRTSRLAAREAAAANNHGTWFAAQYIAVGGLIGDRRRVGRALKEAPARLARQVEPSGRQPEEWARSRSFHYHLFNLRAWANLAELGRPYGFDLWPLLRPALAFVAPTILGSATWAGPQILPGDLDDGHDLLRWAGARLGTVDWAAPPSPPPDDRWWLTGPR